MANNRELSQLGSFIDVDNNNGNIGIATLATPSVGIGTTAPEEKLHVVGNIKANEFIGGGVNLTGIITAGGASYSGGTVLSNLKVTGLSTFVGVATFQSPVYIADTGGSRGLTIDGTGGLDVTGISTFGGDLYVDDDIFFGGSLYQEGVLYTSGVGIGSTSINTSTGVIPDIDRIGVGFTDINFVGTGMSVTGYGSTVVVDLSELAGGQLSITTVTSGPVQDISFVGGATTSIIGIATLTDRFVYEPASGEVGIGTAAPGFKLDVVGDINSSTAIRVGGDNIQDEYVRFAIALG